jgi:alcohol dehydrogenase (cytochrome c)
MQNMCMEATVQSGERDPSLVYGFDNEYVVAPGTDDVGAAWAISAEDGTTAWKHEQRAGLMSMVATGGGLVFAGDAAGRVTAFADTTVEALWEPALWSPVSGYPVSFAVAGRQYVAVTTGPSLVAMASRRVAPELPPDDGEPRLYVFALPQAAGGASPAR